jgi:hypothetical protein
MVQQLFKHPHHLLVDACPNQHGTFLERGEYLQALDIAEEETHKM